MALEAGDGSEGGRYPRGSPDPDGASEAPPRSLPQTLLHGDMHVGNTYQVGNRGGLLDWQLMSRGHFMHDVSYYIQTSLSVENRRKHERDLLKYYLEDSGSWAPQCPNFDSAWLTYRQCSAWNVYIGWLTTDVQNYGWEILCRGALRVMTAYEDLEAAKAIAALLKCTPMRM